MDRRETSSLPPPLSAEDVTSFAYKTVKDRLPVILTKVIDLLFRERNNIANIYGEVGKEEGKEVTGKCSMLRNEMQTNKPLKLLEGKRSDVIIWNDYLRKQTEEMKKEPRWFEAAWLYVECYMYRRIQDAFDLTSKLQDFDPFKNSKEMAFQSSLDAALYFGKHILTTIEQLQQKLHKDSPEVFEHFQLFLQVSLWGNKCDLSISAGQNVAQKESPVEQIHKLQDQILVNDTRKLLEILHQANHDNPNKVTLSLVLDNAGFELFTDLCLVEILQQLELVTFVNFYVKDMPWYVSDATEQDFLWILEVLGKSEHQSFQELSKIWIEKLQQKLWTIEKEKYWTLPFDYSVMEEMDPALYAKLSASQVIIFKGDLNYRKLTGDRQWDFETPFQTSLQGFLPAPICALRTLKADTVTGLSPGQGESIAKSFPDWMISGDFGLIQIATP
ncbi:protein-glutamate O-methyltransferase-like isoform X1 [Limulus polyphemus]|uniref:Sugar phosphate phosphatase n=1 Tax=Limulus polyphemus TaxID=6850 RepID=A0ABM1BRF1_LIMPO|nr:protein-glutamate O-methyltransferase-like isoform X1 [Limulus polyphemus]